MGRRKKYLFYLLSLVLVVLLAEVTARGALFWKYRRWDCLVQPARYLELYYPGILELQELSVSRSDDTVDVLFLGGSVLNEEWGSVGYELANQLEEKVERKVRVHNMAFPSHTSKDSYIKYRLLENQQFDLVVLYHGINEVRFNNCPESVFRKDYKHVSYYRIINSLLHPVSRISVLPFATTYMLAEYWEEERVPRDIPANQRWLEYGDTIRTIESFRLNYQQILALSQKRQDPVLLPTFCSYVPENYHLDLFNQHLLDYRKFRSSIEVWGKPNQVVKGVRAHNQVIREWNKMAVDVDSVMHKNGQNFDDICHFTEQGSAEFVRIILPEVIKRMGKKQE